MTKGRVILLILIPFLLILGRETAFAFPKNVRYIKEHPKWYHRKRVEVSGYVAEAKYIPHDSRAVLTFKLIDRIIKPEEIGALGRDEYLLCQEVGYNIGIINRVFNEARLAQEKGEKIIVKGRYDKDLDLLNLNEFIYFVKGQKHHIFTDVQDEYGFYPRRYRRAYVYPHFFICSHQFFTDKEGKHHDIKHHKGHHSFVDKKGQHRDIFYHEGHPYWVDKEGEHTDIDKISRHRIGYY